MREPEETIFEAYREISEVTNVLYLDYTGGYMTTYTFVKTHHVAYLKWVNCIEHKLCLNTAGFSAAVSKSSPQVLIQREHVTPEDVLSQKGHPLISLVTLVHILKGSPQPPLLERSFALFKKRGLIRA